MLYKNLKDNQLFRADLKNGIVLYKVGDILFVEHFSERPEENGTEAGFEYDDEDIVYPVKATKSYEQERVMLEEIEEGDRFIWAGTTFMLIQKFSDETYNTFSYSGSNLKEFRNNVEVTPFAT